MVSFNELFILLFTFFIRCKLPGVYNDSHAADYFDESMADNIYTCSRKVNTTANITEPCSQWVYDTSVHQDTLVSEVMHFSTQLLYLSNMQTTINFNELSIFSMDIQVGNLVKITNSCFSFTNLPTRRKTTIMDMFVNCFTS